MDPLAKTLREAIELYVEYREQHGYEHDHAVAAAVTDTLEGIGADISIEQTDSTPTAEELADLPY